MDAPPLAQNHATFHILRVVILETLLKLGY